MEIKGFFPVKITINKRALSALFEYLYHVNAMGLRPLQIV